MDRISIILPAKNESTGLQRTLPAPKAAYPEAEIIVVDDGSTDGTADVARSHGAIAHRIGAAQSDGAAIKRGARAASGAM